MRGQLVGFAVFCLVLVAIAGVSAAGPVSRARVERFARRQGLLVTAANGDQIIRYLATTRRWRVAGIMAGYLLGATVSLMVGDIGNSGVIALFGGWFAGALVAEIRVAHLAHGATRVASLQPRQPRSYLPRTAWWLVPAAAGLAVVVSAAMLVAWVKGSAQPDRAGVVWLLVALATAGTVRAIQLSVLRRPQPVTPPDLLAADDAIRSRSLHVLAGGGSALVLLCVVAQLGTVHPADPGPLELVRGVGLVLVLIVGWAVSTAAWSTRRDGPIDARPVTRTPGPQ